MHQLKASETPSPQTFHVCFCWELSTAETFTTTSTNNSEGLSSQLGQHHELYPLAITCAWSEKAL